MSAGPTVEESAAGIRVLVAEPDIRVVGVAVDGHDAVRSTAELHPDVVLMDVRMPHLDGVEATRRIVAARSAGAVVMITTFDDEEHLLDSIRAGASGFLLKDAGPDLLAAAVRVAHRGDSLIDPAMTRSLIQHRLDAADGAAARVTEPSEGVIRSRRMLDSLSAREREVLGALAGGMSNQEIAAALFLSEATVKTHVARVLVKTETRSRVQAAVFAYEVGFVRPGWLADG